ncbi:MAG: HD domain-containing protein [Bdellovibrionales bacterium]|nr:HD domain-containing protein [Bdellovibrionales bacterium]
MDQVFDRNPILCALRKRVREIPPADAGHDFNHILRVARLSLRILREEARIVERRSPGIEEEDAVVASALLHDCVPVAKNSPLRKESARLCAEKAGEWLGELGWKPESMRTVIQDAILDHSFSGGRVPVSLIGKSLQDADRLEALGALGLYRTIATGVSMGASLFHENDPFADQRELDDRAYTLDHFFTKLLKLPETFQTESAKTEAWKRARYLQGFVDQLKHELG